MEFLLMTKANGNNPLSDIPAIVLCGGRATRLIELTEDRIPKALVQIGHKTLLDHTFDLLAHNGIRRAILAVSYHSQRIIKHVANSANSGLEVSISETITPLGIVPSIIAAFAQFEFDSTFLIAGADEICENVDLGPVYDLHRTANSIATLLLTDHISSEYSSLKATLDQQGRVTSLSRGIPTSEFTATGIAFLEPSFVARALQMGQDEGDHESLLKILLPQLISEQRVFGAVCPMRQYIHVSTPEAYRAACRVQSENFVN
jgi:NDP-sugar pyrophosphorylase family protein